MAEWISIAIAALVAIFAALAYAHTRRDIAVAEGKRQQELATLEKELEAVASRVSCLEAKVGATDVDLAEIKTDLKHVLGDISKLFDKIDSMKAGA